MMVVIRDSDSPCLVVSWAILFEHIDQPLDETRGARFFTKLFVT